MTSKPVHMLLWLVCCVMCFSSIYWFPYPPRYYSVLSWVRLMSKWVNSKSSHCNSPPVRNINVGYNPPVTTNRLQFFSFIKCDDQLFEIIIIKRHCIIIRGCLHIWSAVGMASLDETVVKFGIRTSIPSKSWAIIFLGRLLFERVWRKEGRWRIFNYHL